VSETDTDRARDAGNDSSVALATPSDAKSYARLLTRERMELLTRVRDLAERPLLLLSFVWLALLVLDLTRGLDGPLDLLTTLIWLIFVADFALEFGLAPDKRAYLRHNWLLALSLVVPAFRILRIFPAIRLLGVARAAGSLNLVAMLGSANRGARSVERLLGHRGLGAVAALTVLVILLGAAGMLSFENPAALHADGVRASASGGLTNYGDALWSTAMLMTTTGAPYLPQTLEGRILTGLLALYAVAIFGYVTANVASYFVGQDRAKHDERESREETLLEQEVSYENSEIVALRREMAALRAQLANVATQLGSPQPPPAPDRPADVEG
jgi:voltage-gated potassium channel